MSFTLGERRSPKFGFEHGRLVSGVKRIGTVVLDRVSPDQQAASSLVDLNEGESKKPEDTQLHTKVGIEIAPDKVRGRWH